VQVQHWPEVSHEGLAFSKKVGVVTQYPEEVKWVVNEISVDRITPEGPLMGWLADVVFLDEQDRPLAWARINVGGRELRIMPCIRTWRGYIVPVTRSTIDDFRTVDCGTAWRYLYQHLPVVDAEELAQMRAFYKQSGLDPETVMFGSHAYEVKPAPTNSIPVHEQIRKQIKGQASKSGTE
jgi:hypothetical protein